MFNPKCYTLKNKPYDPKREIRTIHKKIYEWITIVQDMESYDTILENINTDNIPLNVSFYNETLEGWTLLQKRNHLKETYPVEYKQVLIEERTSQRETLKMMKEDDYKKW